MAKVTGLACVRCGRRYPITHYASDCPDCRPVVRSNLTVVYDGLDGSRAKPAPGPGLGRFSEMLPVDADQIVSLGEGGTPLIHLRTPARRLGLSNVYLKDESRNPTWSFKDRLACLAVSSARQLGAKVIVSSSSGNAGAAAAAYAAKADMACIVFTFGDPNGAMAVQMRNYGAMVLSVADKADRWTLMRAGIEQFGWFPTSPFFGPVVGSNPFGIEGYKTLAYEIAESLDWSAPDWCILPVCYGDALIGMWKGFAEMVCFGWISKMPRMAAAEIYGSLGEALEGGQDAVPVMPKTHDTIAISIGATQGAFQALDTLRRSRGLAMSVTNAAMEYWQAELAATDGVFLEPTSVAPLDVLARMKEQRIVEDDDTVVLLGTASGLKDPGRSTARLPAIPLVPPNPDAALAALETTYGFKAGAL